MKINYKEISKLLQKYEYIATEELIWKTIKSINRIKEGEGDNGDN